MSEETKPVWRGRALAVAGLTAAVAGSGLIATTSADAATPTPARTNPTITVTAPKTLANDFSGPGQLSIEINNSASGNQAIPGTAVTDNTVANTAKLTLNVTVPAGVACSSVYAQPVSGTPAAANAQVPDFSPYYPSGPLGGTSPSCTGTVTYTQPANSDYTYNYNFYVYSLGSSAPTGTVTTSAALAITDGNSGNVNTIASNSASTTLAASAAPTLSTSTPPSAIIYNDYSATVVSSTGTPSATPNDYSVFFTPTQKDSDGTYPNGFTRTATTTAPGTNDAAIALEDDLYLDTVTGKIVGNPNETDSAPEYSYTIIANNGVGGATAAQVSPANPGGNTAKPNPGVQLHDVQSAPFTIPVLFSDVSTTSTFGPAIYDLSDSDGIKGFADGTFRPGQKVTRQEFVNILVSYDPQNRFPGLNGTGECTTVEPSAFTDVPNSSIFCEAIKQLSQYGIVKGQGGKFFPTRTVSRGEITAFLYRFYAVERTGNVLNGDAPFTSPSPFKDVTSSNVFAGDIEWAAKNNIVNGYTDGTFRPANATTRDAAAAVIDRTGDAL